MHTVNLHVDDITKALVHTYTVLLEMLERKNKTYWIQQPGNGWKRHMLTLMNTTTDRAKEKLSETIKKETTNK